MVKWIKKTPTILINALAVFSITACGSPSDDILPGGVLLTYTPTSNASGMCQPERLDMADTVINGNRLVAIRGETSFQMPTGNTDIPFQSVHKYPDEKGFSDDKFISILNYEGVCKELVIKVTVEYCEYFTGTSREKLACPEIQVRGVDSFAGIEIIREDLEQG